MTNRRVTAIGSFDGVHKGHAAVLRKAVERARGLGVKSLALSFATPPRMILNPRRGLELLTTPSERRALIRSLGVDEVRFLHFSRVFAKNTPRRFFDEHLTRRFRAAGLVVGPDFRFGHRRRGGLRNLKEWGGPDLPIWSVKTATAHAHKLSSRIIRRLLPAGRLEEAEKELGHRYVAEGRVTHGQNSDGGSGFRPSTWRSRPARSFLEGFTRSGCFRRLTGRSGSAENPAEMRVGPESATSAHGRPSTPEPPI